MEVDVVGKGSRSIVHDIRDVDNSSVELEMQIP